MLIAAVFAGCFYLPVGHSRFDAAILEALSLVKWYAREHVLLCLVPAFFIAGAISVFVSQASVMKYLGARANKVLAYGVASVSGSVLAVCSCTVLPLFAGIYRMGAGLGPATAFLYAGPAINVLAIVLTARVLGFKLGLARAIGAIAFSIVIGLLMHVIFRREELEKARSQAALPEEKTPRPLWKDAVYFALMIGILVFANWARSGDVRAVFLCCPNGLTTYEVEGRVAARSETHVEVEGTDGRRHVIETDLLREVTPADPDQVQETIYRVRWAVVGLLLLALALVLWSWFTASERVAWVASSWGYAKQILPLLLVGVFIAGGLLGSPGREGVIPSSWITSCVGGNGLHANLFASVAGAFMYFATLTEVPILERLIDNGMGQGPALALLLAGPALSLPNMLVIRSVMGTKKTVVFVLLVVAMATASGMIFGLLEA
jgi:uncharacterized membrane protein YraQ (UPF0718 family)